MGNRQCALGTKAEKIVNDCCAPPEFPFLTQSRQLVDVQIISTDDARKDLNALRGEPLDSLIAKSR
jgi:hypothetical protein